MKTMSRDSASARISTAKAFSHLIEEQGSPPAKGSRNDTATARPLGEPPVQHLEVLRPVRYLARLRFESSPSCLISTTGYHASGRG